MNVVCNFFLGGVILYYSFLRFLPSSTFPVLGHGIEKMRWCCGKLIFRKMGRMSNIEQGAHFGKGFDIEWDTILLLGKIVRFRLILKLAMK